MFNLDPGKLIVIAVVAIILLGPDRLPQVARQVGGAWKSFNEFRHRMESEVRGSMPDLPPTSEIARLARSPSALLHHLSTLSPEEEKAKEEATEGTADSPNGAADSPDATAGSADGAAASSDEAADSPVVAHSSNGDTPAAPAADSSAQGTRAPVPASTPTPVPQPSAHSTAHEESPTRAPDVIVPGDPTLN